MALTDSFWRKEIYLERKRDRARERERERKRERLYLIQVTVKTLQYATKSIQNKCRVSIIFNRQRNKEKLEASRGLNAFLIMV